jgi:hypothetical protein
MKAFNTVEEYNVLTSYGQDRGGFTLEGELPETEDSTYVRRAQLVKFMGTTREVTHPMTLVNTNVGDIINREMQNGTLWLLRKINRALVYGNSEIIPQEFNGLYQQHSSIEAGHSNLDSYLSGETVIDLRGKHLTQQNIEDAAQGIIQNFGFGDTLYASPAVLSGFAKEYYEKQRIILNNANVTNGVVGSAPKVVTTTVGDINLKTDIFLNKAKARKGNDAALHSKAPAAVTADATTPIAGVADATGNKFAGFTGGYRYAVAAVNRFGESALTVLGANAVTVAAGQSVDLKFTDGGGAVAATGYVIYRTKKDVTGASAADAVFYPIMTIKTSDRTNGYDGGAAGIVRDRNRFIEDTNEAFVLQADAEVFSFKQLAPLMKMDLALLSPSFRFMLLMYGTPMLYAPKKMVRIINIGAYVA